MKKTSDRTKEIRDKVMPLLNTHSYEWSKLDSFTDREIEILKIILLRNISNETTATTRNTKFILMIIVISLVITLVAIIGNS